MKTEEVQVGGVYKVKVGANIAAVKITQEKWIGGDATMPDGKLLKLANVLDAWVASQTRQ